MRVLSPRKLDPPILGVPLRALQRALNSRDEVEVAVEGGFGGELAALEVGGWIADAGALGPEFVAACAGEGAGACRAAWAAVFGGVDVAGRAWLDWIDIVEVEVGRGRIYQIEQSSLSRGSELSILLCWGDVLRFGSSEAGNLSGLSIAA